MKKLLIILMVVAMASFLFVGCMPGVTPPVDDEDEDEEPVVTAAEAVVAVRDAAIVLDLAGFSTAGDIEVFLDALADTNFTDYDAANDNAYVAAAILGDFSAVTTVAEVDTAITAVNTGVTEEAAVAAVNAATTSAALNTALANDAFTDYDAANSVEYWLAVPTTFTGALADVAAVDAAITAVNAAVTAVPTVTYAATGDLDTAVDAGETLTFTFSRPMVPIIITAANIDTVLKPSVGTHLDGAGNIGSAVWSTSNTVLTITYTAGVTVPTITAADTIAPTGFWSAAGVALPAVAGAVIGLGF